jgi:hypothetical protein
MAPTSNLHQPERAARNQARFREYNERIEPHNAVHHWVDPPYADWVCECARDECLERVYLTTEEYEAVRANPAHFFVAPSHDHVLPDVERVVARHERYWMVEKQREAADVAERLDERGEDAALPADEVVAHSADENPWSLPTLRRE